MANPKHHLLRKVRLFASLTDADCDALLAVLKARRGASGDVLFRQGDRGDSLMVVLEGELVARVKSAAGVDEEVGRFRPGEVVGEMAFVDAEPRSATVATLGGAVVVELTRPAMAELRQKAPRVAAAIQREVLFDVARRLRDAGERVSLDGGPHSERMPAAARAEAEPRRRSVTEEQLRGYPALRAYEAADVELLAYVGSLRAFAVGATLVREREPGDAAFLLLTGTVVVSRGRHAGSLATLGPGSLVGQLALIDQAPRSATVTAASDTIALELGATAFARLMQASTPIALRFQDQVALAGVRQLRAATRALAAMADKRDAAPESDLDDWDEGPGTSLELAVDPASLRR